jgi:hypothetical protein
MSFLQKEHELWPAEERVELISRTELNVQLINAQLAQISIQLDSVATSAHVATLVANMRSATTRLELHRSLKLRFKFDKNCAIFAPALFRAACSAPDATLALAAARLLTMVLKFVLSSSAGISKLRPFRLPWPTLLDRLRALAEPRLATAGIDGVEGRLFVSLFVLAKVARRFFFDDELASPDSSRALVARLESQLACGLGDSSAFDAQVMLLAFTSVRSAVPLDPQLVPLVFRYWPTVVDVPEWDARWMWLLARCSRAHSNSLQWSDTQVATICNVALQWLDVMLAGATERFKRHEQRGLGGALNWLQPESTGVSFAKWFASAVTPRTDALVDGVARLLTTVDGYTHPANGGRHASRASLLMVEIARQLARRCVRERTEAASVAAAAAAAADEDEAIEDDENEGGGDADVDDEDDDDKDARVDDDDDVRTLSHIAPERRLLSSANASLSPFEQSPVVRRLVPLLLSMASKALYSRGQREQQHAVNTIRALAFLAPDFVLPQVYERALVALSSDTDAHQTPVSFNVVSHTLIDACTLLGVSKLRRFLPAFAELSLVALGANDMPRTRSALQFALVLLSAVPLAAVPSSATDDEAEDAREVLEQLIGYPEQLLRRILDLLSHAETARPSSDTDATSDSASASGERHELHTSIVAVVETALQQFAGDAAQRTECIELILRTVPTLVPHGATATYAAVFGAAVRAQATPSAVIKALLARFGAALDGWSAESTQLPLPAPALVHALQLLATTASQLRDAVPTHWAALQKIAERGMAVDQPIAVTRAAVSLMHALYATALTTTVAECRSLQSADELREHWRHWGKRYRFKEVQIEWVRTGDEARQAAIAAARAVLADAQEQLSKPLTQLGVRALIRRLQALISGWSGPTALVGQNDSVVDANASGGVEYFSLRYVGTDGADAVVAARTELAQSAALLVSKLLAELTAQLPDDTVAMLRALTCAQDLLSRFGSVNVSQFPLAVARSVVKDPLGPRWTRGTIVAIVARHRHKHRATLGCGTGSVTAQLLASVGEVCSSLYSEVRKSAQVALYEAASLRPSAARPLVEPLFEQLRLNQDRADSPAAEKMRTALVTGTLHKLSLLAVVHDAIPFPATRLRLLTFVCTDGARYDRLQSQARLSSLFVQLLSPHDPVTHPRPSADELGVAIDTCLRVAQSGESHWRYRVYASVVLLQYALPRAGAVGGAVDDERLTRVVAHFADCAVGSLRPLRLIGRMVTTRLLAGVQRIASNGADLVDVSDDEVRAFAARIGAGGDVGDDADDSALYFDDAPWVGRVLVDASALADGRKFARGAAHAVAREQLPPAVRELERRFTDAQFVGKLCDMAALDRVVNEDERAALMSAFARGMGGGMGGDDDTATDHVERVVSAVLSMAIEFSSRSGMTSKSKSSGFDKAFARLAHGASRSFGWQRCGTLLLACAERHDSAGDREGRPTGRSRAVCRSGARVASLAECRTRACARTLGRVLATPLRARRLFGRERRAADGSALRCEPRRPAPRGVARGGVARRVARRRGARARCRQCVGAGARARADARARRGARLARRGAVCAAGRRASAWRSESERDALLAGAIGDGRAHWRDCVRHARRARVSSDARAD